MPVVLGHARSLQAIHGGQATHDTSDSQKSAVLLRGGMRPQTSVYPAERRAPRDLLRRRRHLTRTRAERLAHIQQTNSQDHLPEIGKQLADKANRAGVAERWPDPAGQKSLAVDLGRMGYYDQGLNDLECTIVHTAQHHQAQTLYRLQSVPGSGTILARGLLDEMPDMGRFPRVQDVVSSCRLVTCTKEAAGKRYGTSGAHIGHASRTGAFSEAAGLCLRNNPAGPKDGARLEKHHGKGQAVTILAHQ